MHIEWNQNVVILANLIESYSQTLGKARRQSKFLWYLNVSPIISVLSNTKISPFEHRPRSSDSPFDSDGDGIGDNADTDDDGDGISDAQEALDGTDPLKTDTDGDGLSDAEEATTGTNPLVGDTDGDDYSDSEETDYDTDPLDADSYPIIRGLNWGLIKTVLDQQNQSAD